MCAALKQQHVDRFSRTKNSASGQFIREHWSRHIVPRVCVYESAPAVARIDRTRSANVYTVYIELTIVGCNQNTTRTIKLTHTHTLTHWTSTIRVNSLHFVCRWWCVVDFWWDRNKSFNKCRKLRSVYDFGVAIHPPQIVGCITQGWLSREPHCREARVFFLCLALASCLGVSIHKNASSVHMCGTLSRHNNS